MSKPPICPELALQLKVSCSDTEIDKAKEVIRDEATPILFDVYWYLRLNYDLPEYFDEPLLTELYRQMQLADTAADHWFLYCHMADAMQAEIKFNNDKGWLVLTFFAGMLDNAAQVMVMTFEFDETGNVLEIKIKPRQGDEFLIEAELPEI